MVRVVHEIGEVAIVLRRLAHHREQQVNFLRKSLRLNESVRDKTVTGTGTGWNSNSEEAAQQGGLPVHA
jgi:hypothetical protein